MLKPTLVRSIPRVPWMLTRRSYFNQGDKNENIPEDDLFIHKVRRKLTRIEQNAIPKIYYALV